MFEFTESALIDATPTTVWQVMVDLERWWPASNPEHHSFERLDDGPELAVGSRLRIRECIAGIPGEATGKITRLEPPWLVTWEAPQARYRWFGVPVTLGEGVTWRIAPRGDQVDLSATVWATFPPGPRGRLLETAFIRLLNGVEKDREHARSELSYLKTTIEAGTGAA